MEHDKAPDAKGQPIAILHDYITQYGGAETVLEALHAIWPSAPIYTTFYDSGAMTKIGLRIPPSSIHALLPTWLPHQRALGKLWTPVYPLLFRRLDLRRYRTIISSSSFAAHQAPTPKGARHICYSHTPPRFLYGLTTEIDHARLRRRFPPIALLYRLLRHLDQDGAARVSMFVANSEEVRRRIRVIYGREAEVIYPPVDTRAFATIPLSVGGDYFLTWGRLVASKRVDIIIQAANKTGQKLIVAGSGADELRLRRMAGANVTFVGRPDTATLLGLLAQARAVLFAAEEDFGLVPVEAMAAGKPVLAYGAGGALESVIAGVTGEFFAPQTAEALQTILENFDEERYDPARCRAQAQRFDRTIFAQRIAQVVALVNDTP